MTTDSSLTLEQFAGAGGIRRGPARWDICAELVLRSETHIGGSLGNHPIHTADYEPDQLLDRDPLTGQPRLRWTSLTGVLRHHLLDRLAGYGASDPASEQHVARLFGTVDAMSVLDGDTVALQPPATAPILTRTHNRVDPSTGAPAAGALWDRQVLPVGTTGTLHLRLTVQPGEDETGLLALLVAAVADLQPGVAVGHRLHVGGRSRTGDGWITARNWTARRVQPQDPAQWSQLFFPDWAELRATAATRVRDSGTPHLTDALEPATRAAVTVATVPDRRRLDTLTVTVAVGVPGPDGQVRAGLLRVGDLPRPGSEIVDLAHRTRPEPGPSGDTVWNPVLGGRGLRALLKNHSRRIARYLADPRMNNPDGSARADIWVQSWWGGDPGASSPVPARIRSDDPPLTGGTSIERGRTTVDSLFGNAVDQHLFTEQVHAGGHATITLTVVEATDAVRGLLVLLVQDLHSWFPATLGGSGHGHLTATAATLHIDHPANAHPVDVLDPDLHAVNHPWRVALHQELTGRSSQ